MATKYRWVVKTGRWQDRHMLPVSGKLESKRDSKALRAAAVTAFETALAKTVPCEDYHTNPPGQLNQGAYAYLERVNCRGDWTVLARYTGRCTSRDHTSGRALAGRWTNAEVTRVILA